MTKNVIPVYRGTYLYMCERLANFSEAPGLGIPTVNKAVPTAQTAHLTIYRST